jgi:hypothetical protein
MEENKDRESMDPQEYGIGDKAYLGCPELICEVKKTKTKKVLSQGELEFNLTLQHYRGRNEHSVRLGTSLAVNRLTGRQAAREH